MESPDDATIPSTSQMRSEIWMPYGDIILQVESTQLRMNRDVLAKHSIVFRHLFACAAAGERHSVNSSTPKFPLLAAMLRLGRKYEITQAEEDALARIRYEFPADFAAFNALETDMTRIKYHKGTKLIDDSSISEAPTWLTD
ncbi:hypothetical protein B0H11DRAFT_2235957 [Mycena galericulata]|nr:hypothetical protein B0H11DRAFT_2235957 [Mycena galericulata]